MPRAPDEVVERIKREMASEITSEPASEALSSLASSPPLSEIPEPSDNPPPSPQQLPAEEIERLIALPDADLLRWVLGVYRDQVKDSKLQEFLRLRGLLHPDLVKHFQLGYSARMLGPMLPGRASKAGAALRGRLQKLGILRSSGHEHLSGRLIVPLWTAERKLGQLYGCSIAPGLRAGTPDHLYLEGSRDHCIFHPYVVVQYADLILCETPIDALAYWSNGLRNVTAACGASVFPEALFESMKRQSTRRVLVAYAHDEAGERGARKVAERLLAAGIDCYRVHFPKGMTVGAIAMRSESAPQDLRQGLRQASRMGSGRPPSEVVPAMPSRTAAGKERQLADRAAGEGELLSSSSAARASSPFSLTTPRPSEIPSGVSEHELVMTLGDRRFRVLLQLEELGADSIGADPIVGTVHPKAVALMGSSAGDAREGR